MCAGMDIDAMLAELVQNRVVNNPSPSATFATFVGGVNAVASAYNSRDTPSQRHPVTKHWMPADPSMAQVRESLMANVVLPLGSSAVRQQLEEFCAAQLIGPRARAARAILLYGPAGTGKTHLAQAAATACGAIFFNLSAGNTEGKFTEKDGQKKLLHMAFEVAKDSSLGPAVIYIDEVEKMIPGPPPKGKPKPDPNGPARFKKDLAVYINSLTAEHACIVIASSSAPEEADPKSVADCFDRFVAVGCPDYATQERLTGLTRVHTASLEAAASLQARLEALEGELSGRVDTGLNAVALHATLGTPLATAVAQGKLGASSLSALAPVMAAATKRATAAGADAGNLPAAVTQGLRLSAKASSGSADDSVAQKQEAAERARLSQLVAHQAATLEGLRAQLAVLRTKGEQAAVEVFARSQGLATTSAAASAFVKAVPPPRPAAGAGGVPPLAGRATLSERTMVPPVFESTVKGKSVKR